MNVLLQNSLAATVLIFAVAALRRLALHSLPKNTFCILWTAAALRLVLPFSPESKYSVFTFFDALLKTDGGDPRLFLSMIPPEGTQAGVKAAIQRPFPVLPALWLVGVCALGGFFLVSYLRAMRKFRRSVPVDGVALPKSLFPVQIRRAEGISGPLTYGFFRPVILLPETTDWTDQENLALVLAHEYTHIRRRDCLTKLLFVAVLCVHWFNPAVWLLCWLANRDIELACDESAIRSLGEARRFDYARTLLTQAEQTAGFLPLFSCFSTSAVEERVVSALKHRRMPAWRVAAACLLVAGMLLVFGTSAAAGAGPAGTEVSVAELLADGPIFDGRQDGVLRFGFGVNFGVTTDRTVMYTEFSHGNISSGAATIPDFEYEAEVYTSIPFVTLDGEPYYLKSGQCFSFDFRDLWVEQGYLWGYLREWEEGEPYDHYVMENGQKVLLKTDFQLLSVEPLSFMVGGERFDCYHTVLESDE